MVRKVVAGVAGAGVFGGHHASKYAQLPGVDLAAIYDIDSHRANALAAEYGAEPFADFDAFLDRVDVVTVAAPASTHFNIAERALASGRHALVEKPIALRLDHADRLIDLASSKKLVLQIGHQERFVFEAFGILTRSRKPVRVESIRSNPPTGRGDDVSVVFDLMIHDIDLVRRLNLGALAGVEASGDGDAIDAELAFDGGAVVTLGADRTGKGRNRRMRLEYDDGEIEIDFVNRTVSNTTAAPLGASFDGGVEEPRLADPLGFGVARFVDAVRAGGRPPITGLEARDSLEWAILIEEAVGARGLASTVGEQVRA